MSRTFSFHDREKTLSALSATTQDLIVIGGGITGAGILLDATTRGIKTALFEMQDFAEGTSGRSTKLVHGGLRYLKQLEFSLVREVGRERAIVYENGPHVTRPEPMLLPLIKGGSIGQFGALFGMWLYDKLAGVKAGEQRRIIHQPTVLAMEPMIRKDILTGGVYYYEYRTDDSRLTMEVLKEAHDQGGEALNYCRVTGFLYTDKKKINGVTVTDQLTGKTFNIKSHMVVNATGPWVDETDGLDESAIKNKLLLSKGAHIVVDSSRLPIGQAMYFDAGKGRMVFAIPREGKVYIGTTETEYKGKASEVRINREDRDYLLTAVNQMFPDIRLTASDVESGWAGVRPLIRQPGKKPGEISRKDETFIYASGLMAIAGGKLTGYRKMAERITDQVSEHLKKQYGKKSESCKTGALPVSGGKTGGGDNFNTFAEARIRQYSSMNWQEQEVRALVYRYGSNCDEIFRLSDNLPVKDYPALTIARLAELEYSLLYEMTIHPLDFFIRRTSAFYFNIHSVMKEKGDVIRYMALKLGWNREVQDRYRLDLERELEYLTQLKA